MNLPIVANFKFISEEIKYMFERISITLLFAAIFGAIGFYIKLIPPVFILFVIGLLIAYGVSWEYTIQAVRDCGVRESDVSTIDLFSVLNLVLVVIAVSCGCATIKFFILLAFLIVITTQIRLLTKWRPIVSKVNGSKLIFPITCLSVYFVAVIAIIVAMVKKINLEIKHGV